MSKAITEAAYHAAKAKESNGDILGAWQALADAGDNYARAGAKILDPNGDSYIKAVVEKTWELSVGRDVYNAKFSTVATMHLSGYLEVIKQNMDRNKGAILPTTFQIEQSYKLALDDSNVSYNASVDAIINSIGGIAPHWANALDLFDGDWSNIYDIDASRIDERHAIYSTYSSTEAVATLWQIATVASASLPDNSIPDDHYAGAPDNDNDGGSGDGDGPPPGTPNPENRVADFLGKMLSTGVKAALVNAAVKATGIPGVALTAGVTMSKHLFGSDSGKDDSETTTETGTDSDGYNPSEEESRRNREESFDRDGASNDDDTDTDRYSGYGPDEGYGPDNGHTEPDTSPSTSPSPSPSPSPSTSPNSRGGDGPSSSPGTSSPSSGGGGWASQGGNTSPVGGPNSNPGNPNGRSRGGDGPSSGGSSRGGQQGGNQGASRGGDAGDGNRGGGNGGNNNGGDSGGGFKPIVLDLDGDGVELVALDESAAFYDINADGYLYNLGWAAADDGILAYDKNADGIINRKDEISFVDYVAGARTDLEGLRHFDANNDGVLDAADAAFGKFRVWQDADQDGASDAGELRTLAAAGIRRIELNYEATDDGQTEDRDGNLIAGQGRYHKTNGARGAFADVAFAAGAFGFRSDGDNLEFKSADDAGGQGKVYVAPADAGSVRMNFASSANAAHIGAIGGGGGDVLDGAGVARDLLLFGDAGADRLIGGSGDDWLAGGEGADTLRGGAGHDVLFFDASDDVNGGAGQDVGVVSGDHRLDLVMREVGLEALHSGGGNDRILAIDSAQGVIIDGGRGYDAIRGSHHRDVLSGGEGGDTIKGHQGDDVILGANGNDRLYGNIGNDILFGGEGDDYLNGLLGDDALYGGAGNDTYAFGFPNVPRGDLADFGAETVSDSGGAQDTVTFGRRRHEELWLSRDGNDLRISVLGGDDEVRIENQFAAGGQNKIERLYATTRLRPWGRYDGQTIGIDALVNAMARFDKPQTGWAGMTAQQRADVHAAWHTVGIAPTVG